MDDVPALCHELYEKTSQLHIISPCDITLRIAQPDRLVDICPDLQFIGPEILQDIVRIYSEKARSIGVEMEK